ncbi:cytidine deaminase [Raphidocelis subcapitata]|uniref:cytidine deaminase n=1 Tax=Raphidocelis subcapitata TaxID=307507 RepID=A0A2V0P3I7_9CHLO|nr:cytidine deaminase [Raphidocelis subcapitata]|eukprot:GBF94426.1 cytidine deaminase [Raphidocelis subcapitata]
MLAGSSSVLRRAAGAARAAPLRAAARCAAGVADRRGAGGVRGAGAAHCGPAAAAIGPVGRAPSRRAPGARRRRSPPAPPARATGAGAAAPPLAGFRLAPEEVAALQRERGCSLDSLLLSLLPAAARLARPPVSNYFVGAVGLAPSGAAYVGVNLEFPGAPLSQSVHAEQFLVANLLAHGEGGLDSLAVSAAPCGHCRQFYSELACADSVRFLFSPLGSATQEVTRLSDLLPARFGPLDLLEPGSAPLLLEKQDNRLRWAPAARAAVGARAGDGAFARAAEAALEAARRSYSPYTRCPSGVALVARGGRVYSGGYSENAAHNPGLAPLQAAVAGAVIGGLAGYKEIEEVVVAELQRGLVQQAGVAGAVARAAAGNAQLPVTVLHVEWDES